MEIIDSHCHLLLNLPSSNFNSRIQSFINARAINSFYLQSINAQDLQLNCEALVNLAPPHISRFKLCIGLHPWFLPSSLAKVKQECLLLQQIYHAYQDKLNFIGIGEVGLDKGTNAKNINFQMQALEIIVDSLNIEHAIYSLHCFKAHQELIAFLKNCPANIVNNCIIHGFNSSFNLALEYVKLGVKLGIGANFLLANSVRIKEVVHQLLELKQDIIRIESDFDGKYDIKYNQNIVPLIYKQISDLV